MGRCLGCAIVDSAYDEERLKGGCPRCDRRRIDVGGGGGADTREEEWVIITWADMEDMEASSDSDLE
jgi:hypothetical protein